jgi:hypothetical protein
MNRILTFGLLLLSSFTLRLAAQGTAFNYQGRLNDTGAPANGTYDFCFTIYDAITNGDQIVAPLTNSAVAVSNGLFSVTLDFGPGIFTGNNYWLDIGVRAVGATNFATLSPRQPVLPVPYAVFASGANNLLGTLSVTHVVGLGNAAFANTNTMTVYAAMNATTVPASGITGTLPANTYYADTNALWFANAAGITDQDARNDLIASVNEIKQRNCWSNLVAFGSLSYRFNPSNNIDFLGNARVAVNPVYQHYPNGAEFYGSNYFTQQIPQLTNFTVCFSQQVDLNNLMGLTSKGLAGILGGLNLIELSNTNDGSSVVFEQMGTGYEKIQMSNGTNFDPYYMQGQYRGQFYGSQLSVAGCPQGMSVDKFSYADSQPLTKHFYAISVKGNRVTAYQDGKLCGFQDIIDIYSTNTAGWYYTNNSQLFYGNYTNTGSLYIIYATNPTAVNTLHIGGGDTNWNRLLDTNSVINGPYGWNGYGTNAMGGTVNGYQVYNTFAESDGGNTNIIPASYASLVSLEFGHTLVSIQGSSIVANDGWISTNLFSPLMAATHQDCVIIQEASGGGTGVAAYSDVNYRYNGYLSGVAFSPAAILLAPAGKFTKKVVVTDCYRNSSGNWPVASIIAAENTVYIPYITNGVEVGLIEDHLFPITASWTGLVASLLTNCSSSYSFLIPEWKYVTTEYMNAQGGDVHPFANSSSCAFTVYSGMINEIFNGGWNVQMPASGVSLYPTAGVWSFTNVNPYQITLTIGGTITNLTHGTNTVINIPATGIFTVPVEPFGDYISIGSSNAPICYLDSTPQ